jgi:hypothetical protein
MEASMRSCSWRSVQLVVLAVIAAVAPGCPSSNGKKAAPNINGAFPADGATVPVNPMVVFQFDRAMDPAFMIPTYFQFVDNSNNAPVTIQIEFEPIVNQVRIVPTDTLVPTHSYDVFVMGTVQSAAGTAMGSAEGITVTAKSTILFQPISGFPSNVSGYTGTNPGEINLIWDGSVDTPAVGDTNPGPGTETVITSPGPPVTTAPVTPLPWYDIYISTAQNGVSYLDSTGSVMAPFKTVSTTSTTLTGLTPNTVYYIKVVPRDSEGNVFESPLTETAVTSMHN